MTQSQSTIRRRRDQCTNSISIFSGNMITKRNDSFSLTLRFSPRCRYLWLDKHEFKTFVFLACWKLSMKGKDWSSALPFVVNRRARREFCLHFLNWLKELIHVVFLSTRSVRLSICSLGKRHSNIISVMMDDLDHRWRGRFLNHKDLWTLLLLMSSQSSGKHQPPILLGWRYWLNKWSSVNHQMSTCLKSNHRCPLLHSAWQRE